MAVFEIAYNKTIAFEGGYVNNPNDNGGETYKGISRNNFPNWLGWKIVDTYKKAPFSAKSMDNVLKGNQKIQNYVKQFYLDNFWNPIIGDGFTNQESANNVFDFAVNSGVSRAVRYAQKIVNTTIQDGVMGKQTLYAINNDVNFVAQYKQARAEFFNKIVANNPSQKIFLVGWLNRNTNA